MEAAQIQGPVVASGGAELRIQQAQQEPAGAHRVQLPLSVRERENHEIMAQGAVRDHAALPGALQESREGLLLVGRHGGGSSEAGGESRKAKGRRTVDSRSGHS